MLKWEQLPDNMRTKDVKRYYDMLQKKKFSLFVKRLFDVAAGLFLTALLSPVFLAVAIAVGLDSKGPVFFRQERITRYAKSFCIFKFRTMQVNAESCGAKVTVDNDKRITRVGGFLRKYRFDELPQLFNVIAGQMSFVGTRPEVPKYVRAYTPEMMATLLLPAGITSKASIKYKNEMQLLCGLSDEEVERKYIEVILPQKMRYNLAQLEEFSLLNELKIMLSTLGAVFLKERN